MASQWGDRAYNTQEAADVAGVCRATLDTWTYRHRSADLSERREGRRWWSPSDVTAIRTALRLNACMPLAQAIPTALQNLLHRPPPDVFLVVDRGRSFTSDANTAAQFAIERGATIVPIGALAADAEDACAVLFERDAAHPQPITKESQ